MSLGFSDERWTRSFVGAVVMLSARIWSAALMVVAGGCTPVVEDAAPSELVLEASDGLQVAATLVPAHTPNPPGLIAVHQLGGRRSDWAAFAQTAARRGYTVIAIDMRGHGDSARLNPDAEKYRGFSEDDWNSVLRDIDAAKQALLDRGVNGDRIGIIGASIGANLAARYAAEHEDVQALVMLSPGTEYKDIRVAPAFEAYGARPSLLIAGEGDRYSAETCRDLHGSAQGFCELREFPGTHHGTALLDSSPNVASQILQWCDTVLAHAKEPN